jgi:hypothetical protein
MIENKLFVPYNESIELDKLGYVEDCPIAYYCTDSLVNDYFNWNIHYLT